MRTRLLRICLDDSAWELMRELAELFHYQSKLLGKPISLNVSGVASLMLKEELLRNAKSIRAQKAAMGIDRLTMVLTKLDPKQAISTSEFYRGTDLPTKGDGPVSSVHEWGPPADVPGPEKKSGQLHARDEDIGREITELFTNPNERRRGPSKPDDLHLPCVQAEKREGESKTKSSTKKRKPPKGG